MEIKADVLSPQRSRTDPEATAEKTEKKHHHTRRLRATSFRNKGQHEEGTHKHRRHAKDVVQSAIETRPPISFDALLRRDRRSPSPSKRHASGEQSQDAAGRPQEQPALKEATARDVEEARKANEQREKELRRSLQEVEDVAMSSTRQLDDTYYSILEKASILRSTVQSLQQLAEESRKMHRAFEEDSQKLQQATKDNLTSFNDFTQQEESINELVHRLQTSRTQSDELNERLEAARRRVEAFEQCENEKEATRKQRWRFVWATLAVVLVLVASILIARNRRAVGHQLNDVGSRLARMGDVVEEVAGPLQSKLRPSPSEDARLKRLFDEL